MSKKSVLGLVIVLMIIGLATRFLFLIPGYPHLPNFTALGAVALFGAFHLDKWKAFVLPLLVLWVSDLMLNNLVYAEYFSSFSIIGDIWVYVGFAAMIVVGRKLLKKLSFKNIITASLVGGIAFYIITNFAVWVSTPVYPKNIAGLVECYSVALPFFRNALMGNVLFSLVLFGVYDLVTARKLTFLSPSVSA